MLHRPARCRVFHPKHDLDERRLDLVEVLLTAKLGASAQVHEKEATDTQGGLRENKSVNFITECIRGL